jgi:hypothetical protein
MSNTTVTGPNLIRLVDNASLGYSGIIVTTTNGDLVLSPNGTGAIQAQIPDSGTGGGNLRGDNAVDLQQVRTAATQVASAVTTTISGGRRNTASGAASVISGGQDNTASGTLAMISGGSFGAASGAQSTIGGDNNTASGTYSVVPGGFRGVANQYGMSSYASGRFAADGDAQYSRMIVRTQTIDTTATILTADGGAGSAATRITIPNNTGFRFNIMIMARDIGSTDSRWWDFNGGIIKDTTALSTALVGSNAANTGFNSLNAQGWAATATADTTNGALAITVTGALGVTIRWVAVVNLCRVSF